MKKIIPVFAIVLLAMVSCHRTKVVTEGEKDFASVNYTDSNKPYDANDSFIVD